MTLDIGPIAQVVLLLFLAFLVVSLGIIVLQWVFRRYL